MHWASLTFLLFAAPGLEAVHFLVVFNDSITYVDGTMDTNKLVSISKSNAIDYHFQRNEVYFSVGLGQIKRARLHPDMSRSQEPITIVEMEQNYGLAVDWINDNLYWTQVTRMTVEMSTLDGLYRRVLFNSTHGVKTPKGIALDPFQGLMFWIDDQTIESSGLDGKSKSTIVKAGSSNFNGITLDLTKRTVYVLETGSGKLISYNYDGSNKRVLFYSKNHRMASGLTLDGNMIYWIKNWTQLYYMEDMKNKTVTRKKLTLSADAYELKAVDMSLQEGLTVTNPCDLQGCSHSCVYGRNMSASCVCPYGFTLRSDGKSCHEEGYLLISWKRCIKRYSLEGRNIQLQYTSHNAIALAYHYKKQLVFWSEVDANRIYRAPLEQLHNQTVVVDNVTCYGLAVDWVHDVLYWTDREQKTLEAAYLDGSKRRTVFKNLDQPKDIAVDPHKRYMFWTDCGTEAKIERADLDGSERTTIITQDIRSPNAITIDFSEGRIYWVDGDLGTISSSRYSGEDRKTIPGHNSKTLEFLGVSLFRSDIYLTDSTLRSLAVGKKSPDQFRHRTFFTNPNSSLSPNGVKVVHSSLQREQGNPCDNMSCVGLCLGSKEPQKVHCLDVAPECETGEFLCNGVQDCADGSDESTDRCTVIDSLAVYSLNRTSVSLRVTVPEVTKKNLRGFLVKTNSSEPQQKTAEPCPIWPESYCFTVSSLNSDANYIFQVQAVLKTEIIGKSYETSATTGELYTAPGPPQDLVHVKSTNTSVTLQWRHPNESNGKIHKHVVHISENITSETSKHLNLLEIKVETEAPVYSTEVGSLKPATRYLVEVAEMGVYMGQWARTVAYTAPPAMPVSVPSVYLRANGKSVSWNPQDNLLPDQDLLPQLIECYLLLVLTQNVSMSPRSELESRVDIKPFQSLIDGITYNQTYYHVHVYQAFSKDDEEREKAIPVDGLIAGYKYRLAWAQVSKYENAYNMDYIVSKELDATFVQSA